MSECTLTNSGGSVTFVMQNNWQPEMFENGSVFLPLGNPFYTKSTDGFKGLGGTLEIVSTSAAMDDTVVAILNAEANMTLTLPDGRSFTIMTDPRTPPKAIAKYSTWGWQYVNVWSIKYLQAA